MKKSLYTAFVFFCILGHAHALVDPHYGHESVACGSCHTFKNPPGPNATKTATNYALCQQCHKITTANYFPFEDAFKSFTVGISGAFHRWEAYTSSSRFGASAPSSGAMRTGLEGGKITCSSCHNQHAASNLIKAGRLHRSSITKVSGSGIGTISYNTAALPYPAGYTVEIIAGGSSTTATYRVSYNNGTRWFGWNGSSWVTYNNNPRVAGGATPQSLDNISNATITFSGGAGAFVAGDKWKFYVGYPYLRAYPDVGSNTTGRKFCRDCHSQRAQTHYAGGNRWDGKVKSHPVGVALNSNGGGYDRKPWDVDGAQQGASADTNTTNDLLLFQGITSMTTFGNLTSGDVQCMTCHAPHWTDSNSMTRDRR